MQRILRKMVIDAFSNDVYSMLEIVGRSHKDSFILPKSSKGRNKKITTNIIVRPYLKQRLTNKKKLSKAEKEAFDIVQEAGIYFDVLPVGIVKLSQMEDELTLMQKTTLLFVDDVNYSDFEEDDLLERIIYLFIERVENYFLKAGLLVNAPVQEDHATTGQGILLYNDDNMREVKELSLKKWTIKDIARKIGISVSTVKRYRKIQGIKRFKP